MIPQSLSCWLSLALLAASAPTAEPAHREPPVADVTLDQALSLAEARSPLLVAAEHEIRAQQGRLQQAGLLPNPEFAATETNLFNDDLQGFDGRASTYEIEQPIELGGRRGARRAAAGARVDAAGLARDIARLDLRMSTTRAYNAAIAAGERRRIEREALDLARRVEDVARARVEAGRLAPVEASRASIAVTSTLIELERLDAELDVELARLSAQWGGEPRVLSVAGAIGDPTTLPPLDQLRSLLDSAPDAARWAAASRENESLMRLARADAAPTLSISGGWTTYRDADDSAWLLGLRVGLPIFNRNQGGIAEALALRDKADAEGQAAQSDRLLALSTAHRRANLSASAAQALAAQVLPATRLTFETATEGFEAGKLPYIDVLDARRTLLDAERQHLESLIAHQTARAEVVRLIGAIDMPTPSETSLPVETP